MDKVRPVITEKQYYGALRLAKKLAGTRGHHVKYFGEALNELLNLAELITDPLSQDLMKKAAEDPESKAKEDLNKTVIRKVKVLQGMAKAIAEEYELEPNDLVILTVSLEKIIGDPLSYLLKQIENGDITNDDIQRFGELFVENINKELGIEEEYRHSTGTET